MEVRESAQDYLESILVLSRKQATVRAADICAYFGYARPTVSVAVHRLQGAGYVSIDEDNLITLTDEGADLAEKVYERHTVIATVLQMLGVSQSTALEDACKIEHDISDESFTQLKAYWERRRETTQPEFARSESPA